MISAKKTTIDIYSNFSNELKSNLVPVPSKNAPVTREKKKIRATLQLFDSNIEKVSSKDLKKMDQVDLEIVRYNSEPSKNVQPLEYWQQNHKSYPILYHVIQHLFCIPATSVPAEQLFSHTGTLWERCNRLSPDKLDKIMVIQESL